MTFRVEVAAAARRDLQRLPEKIAAAVVTFIVGPLAENPMRLSKPLAGDLTGYRSARRGDYRVLVRVDDETAVVLVIRIDHRAHVYRPR